MRLHLPKMLRVALISAMVSMATYNANADDTKLDLYSSSATTKTLDSLTVSGTDRVGYIDSSDNLYTKFNNNTRTQSLTINGDMTIEGNGHVAVGGGNADGGSAAYLKVAAGTLTVKDNAQLDALGCQIKDLVIEGGTVKLDATSTSYCGSGNSSYSASSNKQSTITNSLSISGGKLYMGAYNGAYVTKGLTSSHCSAGFKGTINQTGGMMSVRTDAAFNGAVTINQTGTAESAMYFTEQMEIGTSLTINQSNDNATLGLGRLTGASAYSSKKVIINQSGKGTIKLTQGAHFGKGSTIAINQTGDGTIDFCDWYTAEELKEADRQNYRENVRKPYTNQNATYTIEQTGAGTINIDAKATIIADKVNVGKDATLNVNGNMTITGKASLTGTVNVGANASFTLAETCDMDVTTDLKLSAGNSIKFMVDSATTEGSMQMTETGNLEFTGGTLELSLTEAALTEMAAEAHMEGKEFHVTLIGNLSAEDVLELEGIINDKLVLADYLVELELPTTYALTAQENITIEAHDLIVEDNALKAVVIATNPNVVPEPATATRSLLALAALAARRRRR